MEKPNEPNPESQRSGEAQQPKQSAVAIKPPTVKDYLTSEYAKRRIEEMLGRRSNQFTTSLLSALNSNAKLGECAPATVLGAAMKAAALDLPIDPNLGLAYIIPYNKEAQFQIGYKGFVQLALRSSQYKTIGVAPVYDGQLVEKNPLTGNRYDWSVEPDESTAVIGYVASFQLLNGFEKSLYMTVGELSKHGKRFSQTFRKGYGLWKDDFDSMASKTVLKLLLSKFGILSIEMQQAILADQAVINDEGDLSYDDNTSELEDKIAAAKDRGELAAIMDTLNSTDKLAVQPLVEARMLELAA